MRPLERCAVGVLLLVLTSFVRAEEVDFVWWEGEAPSATNFPQDSWFGAHTFPETREEILSGGDWLANSGPRTGEEAFARYHIRVPRPGTYAFWARKFWKHGPFRWRFDRGEWRTCGRDVGLADSVPIRTHLCVNWVHLGEVELVQGRHLFELRLLAEPGEELTACFDCFLLTRQPFVPRGRLRPGEASGRTEEGWWALEPSPDPPGEAVLDLRYLNETRAGAQGHVRQGTGRFELGDGTPVRFWAVNVGPGVIRLDPGSVEALARRLAREGVNLVRFHGALFDSSSPDPTRIDQELLGRLHHLVAVLREQGIYTFLSFSFPLWFEVRPSYGLPGYEGTSNKRPFTLLFFDPRMQEIWRAWARGVLTPPNPHTGLPLAEDPALAILEIQNEDSFLFHTFKPGETIPAERMELLERRFGEWLARRHGSLARAQRAWGGASLPGDRPEEGRMALWPAWNLTARGHGEGPRRARAADQLRFLVETQRAFYEEAITWLRESCGLGCLVSCSNWKTADDRLLDPLERFTYAAGNLIDAHGYFGGRHEGEGASYSVRVGHRYADRAAVREPEALPFNRPSLRGYPTTISEVGWPNPNRYRADFPFLAAAYGALTGLDGVCFFAVAGPSWGAGFEKFPVDVPTVRGQFPALALLYRQGYVEEDTTGVVRETLSLESLYDFGGAALVAPPALDQLRAPDRPEDPEGDDPGRVDPLAFLAGQVIRELGARPALRTRRLGRLIDRRRRVVTSVTGQHRWDYGQGVVTLDAPCAQGATGFLGEAGPIELSTVSIECSNEYATVVVVSLDGKPLRRSSRILVQAVTEEQPYGFTTEGDRIVALGGIPLLVRELEATVRLRGGVRLRTARVLDPEGHEREQLELRGTGRDLVLALPRDAFRVVLE